jgi:hypothetical protein
VNTGRGQLADVQLTGNSGKGENIVVAVGHFVGDKFLVLLTNEIISALIDKQIALEGRLFVVDGYARLKAAVGGLDVAVAVVDTDDDGIGVVVHKIHRNSFLPLCGDTKIMVFGGGQIDHHQTELQKVKVANSAIFTCDDRWKSKSQNDTLIAKQA